MRGAEVFRSAGLALVVLLAACSPPEDGAEDDIPDVLRAAQSADDAAGAVAEEPGEDDRMNLAERRDDHVAMERVDSAFPHSEHRDLECQRCHQRPPGHETHVNAACSACHGRPAGFADLPERNPAACAACHHENARDRENCRSCHETDRVGDRPVLVAIEITGRDEPRVRRLTFNHANHASRECTSCHTTPATLRFGRDCASCHEAHHSQEAECATCHESVGPPTHTTAVHAGCSGGGCHGEDQVLALAPTRNVCLGCHQDLMEHRPGQQCTVCHRGSWTSLGRGEPGASP